MDRVRLYYMRHALFVATLVTPLVMASNATDFQISSFAATGRISWTGASSNGVCSIEAATAPTGPWLPQRNLFSTNRVGQASLPTPSDNRFYRLLTADISATPSGYSNLLAAYGIIETIAGRGGGRSDVTNYWQPEFEGAPATNADLSRPHFAMADDSGNIYLADKDSHSILEITSDGTIHTFAGTHVGGFNGDGPAPATSLQLNFPNGEWVRGDGTVYILDTDNGRIRRVDTLGVMTTLFTVAGGISTGRGLWVSADESLVYFASGTDLKKWTPIGGVQLLNNQFKELGNLVVDSAGNLFVTDRADNRVFLVSPDGSRTIIAGDGGDNNGGDGFPALQTGLLEVRGVWPLPTGGYLLVTHKGSQVWYVDAAGIIHLLVDGATGNHAGDGAWFHSPGLKVSEVRSVALDAQGNLLIVENDYGYVRRIRFLPIRP